MTRRVKLAVDLISAKVSDNVTDMSITQTLFLLHTTVEEIKDYMDLFSVENASLANHVFKLGSDEEQFVKWNERLQHCVEELGLGNMIKSEGLVDERVDLDDFQQDLVFMKSKLNQIADILYKDGDAKTAVKYLQDFLKQQSEARSTYKTKTAPTAALEIDSKKIKYDKVIGHGGK